jgi:hypothetical protein
MKTVGRGRAASSPTRTSGAAGRGRPFDAATLDPRLARVRRLAWIMDRSIPIGGGRSIGLDPLLGLWPGAGDAIGAAISLFIVFEAARLGLPLPVIGRMIGNIALESLVGTVPLLGDIFDAVWKANIRNVQLVDVHYRPERPDRPVGRIAVGLLIVAVVLITLIISAAAIVVAALWKLISG